MKLLHSKPTEDGQATVITIQVTAEEAKRLFELDATGQLQKLQMSELTMVRPMRLHRWSEDVANQRSDENKHPAKDR